MPDCDTGPLGGDENMVSGREGLSYNQSNEKEYRLL